MAEQLNPALSAALRRMGRRVSIDDLRSRGVRRVRSLGTAEVSLLIERAVNRTLMARTIGVDEAQAAELADRAQREFASQLSGVHDLADSRMAVDLHRREMQEQLKRLRRELGLRRGFVEGEEQDKTPQELEEEVRLSKDRRLKLQACLLPFLQGGHRPPGPAIERVLQNLADVTRAETTEALARQRRQFEAEMEKLARRIEKLNTSLDRSEDALRRVSAAKNLDIGVASIYREVQGMADAEPDRERKKALMASLFEANLALQRQL